MKQKLVKAVEEVFLGELMLHESLADCDIGVEKEITLLVVPTRNDERGFKGTISEVVGYEEDKPATPKPKHPPYKEMAPAMENY